MNSEFTTWQYCTAKRKIRRNNNINETIIFLMGGGGDCGYLQSPNKTNRVCIYLISVYFILFNSSQSNTWRFYFFLAILQSKSMHIMNNM